MSTRQRTSRASSLSSRASPVPCARALGWSRLGVGLWLPAKAVADLRDARTLDVLRAALDVQQLDVVTLNGFPYEAFHAPVVKHAVYRPDWTEPARLEHTLELARLLHALLPEDADGGSISTLPLAWREPWPAEAHQQALGALRRLADGLADLADRAGRPVRVALEPEPGCVVGTVAQAVDVLADLAPDWIGICLDACHLAVEFEDPAEAVRRAVDRGGPHRQGAGLQRAAGAAPSRGRRGGGVRRAALPPSDPRARRRAGGRGG